MKKHLNFSLATLLFGVTFVGCFIAVFATWSTRSILAGAAASLIAASCSLFLPKSLVPKMWRVTLWMTFVAYLSYVASIGPSAWLVATINRPRVRSPVIKKLFMKAYSPVSDVIIIGPESIRSAGYKYIDWWLPRSATIRQHEGRGILLRHEGHGETYLCLLSRALD